MIQDNLTKTIIQDITYSIIESLNSKIKYDISLLSGDFGKVIFLYIASRNKFISVNDVDYHMKRLLLSVKGTPQPITYSNGIAGLCLGLELLDDNGFVEESSRFTESCFKYLSNGLNICLKNRNIDFLHGAVGIGFVFLRHIKTSEFASLQIKKMVNYLYENRMEDSKGHISILFRDNNNRLMPNLSLSHGISSVCIFLSRVYIDSKDRVLRSKCAYMLYGIKKYILGQLLSPEIYGSFTTAYPIETNIAKSKSRLAWCYGDVGIAVALREMGEALNDEICLEQSNLITEYIVSNRLDSSSNYIRDAGLCHGVSGIIQFLRSFSGRNYNIAIDYWTTTLLRFTKQNEDLRTSFGKYSFDSKTTINCLNLLEGDAGIACCLLNDTNIINKILLYE